MTTKLEQAARQALEALETDEQWGFVSVKVLERRLPAITALREALAEQADMNLNCKSVQARLAMSWGYVKAEQAEQEPVANKYNHKRIGWELERTAQGESYYGNALYVAMDLPFLNKREKDCLHRYMHGSELANDRFVLQDIAMKVYSEPESDSHPVRTKDLTDDEIADALYGKGCWRLGVHPDHLREYRRVIQADREKNK